MTNKDTPMARHLFLDMPSSLTLGIVERQMKFAKCYVIPLLSIPAGQGNDHVADKVFAVNSVLVAKGSL